MNRHIGQPRVSSREQERYIGFPRVSSREQQREGFSLEVQEDAFHAYAMRHGGVVDKMFRIAETATKHEQRKIFREAIDYAKRHAAEYAGMLFYKIDRAARNMKDLVMLEEIEKDYGLPFISVTQPVDNTPTGRMVRRTLATIGAFQTEQQALDIQEGIAMPTVATPALWPAWPFLPVVRRTAGTEELGLMFDAMGTSSKPGYSATVFHCNLFLLPPTFEEFLALRKEVHDSAEELIASGWRVD